MADLGDGARSGEAVATPSVTVTPARSIGNRYSPSRRHQGFEAAMTSLKTMSRAVVCDSAPFVRTVRCLTVAKTLSTRSAVHRWPHVRLPAQVQEDFRMVPACDRMGIVAALALEACRPLPLRASGRSVSAARTGVPAAWRSGSPAAPGRAPFTATRASRSGTVGRARRSATAAGVVGAMGGRGGRSGSSSGDPIEPPRQDGAPTERQGRTAAPEGAGAGRAAPGAGAPQPRRRPCPRRSPRPEPTPQRIAPSSSLTAALRGWIRRSCGRRASA